MPISAERIAQTIFAIAAIEVLVCLVAMVWVLEDAKSRGKSGFLVALMILVFQTPGLILWLAFRPEKKSAQ
jgi:hypothetical protein